LHQIQNYYHHLLIIVNPRPKVSLSLLEQYYKRMKFGDLIGVVYYHHTSGPRAMSWVEKTQLANLQFPKLLERITKEPLTAEQVDQLVKRAADYTIEHSSSNVVANFMLSE
jgi:hypothetical protein